MNKHMRHSTTGFTLIELLTVIAIIALLMGLLVPALHKVKDQARKVSTQNLHKVLADGCEAFRGELDEYPRSAGGNPFESSSYGGTPSVYLSGAQWLVLQLAGADRQGFVKKDGSHYYNSVSPDTSGIDAADWLDWYSPTPSSGFRRFGPYVTIDDDVLQSPERFGKARGMMGTLPTELRPDTAPPQYPDLVAGTGGSSDWNNFKIPMAIDAFSCPVIYYAATEQAKLPFSDAAAGKIGRYSQDDNAAMTGGIVTAPVAEGFDLGNGTAHKLMTQGWSSANPNAKPTADSFAGYVYDPAIFGTGTTGKVWPQRADSFLLISPGVDKLYGTGDDIRNF